jgi:hypothetical protein
MPIKPVKKKRVRPVRTRKKKMTEKELLKRASRFVANGIEDW